MYTVLLVEDEEVIRKGICYSVPWEEFGCRVIGEGENGEEGCRLIEELRPDIVITDINTPVMDGLTMIARTKAKYDYAAIILTGYSDFEYAKEAIRQGVTGYVLKPLNMQEMKEALELAVLESQNIRYLRERTEKTDELCNITLIEKGKEYKDTVVQQILEFIMKNYINQQFRKYVGTTVIEYLNRYRIQKALELLKNRDLPVSEIGWECGIGEYKYFNYVFKKYVGCSAREYRTRIRNTEL